MESGFLASGFVESGFLASGFVESGFLASEFVELVFLASEFVELVFLASSCGGAKRGLVLDLLGAHRFCKRTRKKFGLSFAVTYLNSFTKRVNQHEKIYMIPSENY